MCGLVREGGPLRAEDTRHEKSQGPFLRIRALVLGALGSLAHGMALCLSVPLDVSLHVQGQSGSFPAHLSFA